MMVVSATRLNRNAFLYGQFIIKNKKWYIKNNNFIIELLKPPDSFLEKINFKPEIINNKDIYIIDYCVVDNIVRPHIIQYNSYSYYFENNNHVLLWDDKKN